MKYSTTDVWEISKYYHWCVQNLGEAKVLSNTSYGNSRFKIVEGHTNMIWILYIWNIEDIVNFKLCN